MKKIILIILLIINSASFAQKVKISGEVFDEYLVPFSGAKVKTLSGKTTTTNGNGIFEMKVELPVRLRVSSDGFATEEVVIEEEGQHISLVLKESSHLDDVVMSASRTPERIFESPVSISRLGLTDIKKTPSVNFYNALENIRGVSMYNGSMLYKTINTRGFTNTTNFRYVQLIDGVDNVFTQTDLPHGNAHGINELDVESVELLPGASSALYGANAFNGVILMNSKSPFDYGGISVNFKSGVTTQESGTKPFYEPSIRMAYKFDNTFAAKINFSLYHGDEWRANDYRDISTGVAREVDRRTPGYNGVNIYADETQINLKDLVSSDMVDKVPSIPITSTGIKDEFLTDNIAKSKLFDATLHYRPWGNEKLEIKWKSTFSLANYLYQSSNTRYTLNETYYRQHLLEFRGESFYVRGYHTKTDLGVNYNHWWAALGVNNHEMDFFDRLGVYAGKFAEKYNEYIKTNSNEKAIQLAELDARKFSDRYIIKEKEAYLIECCKFRKIHYLPNILKNQVNMEQIHI